LKNELESELNMKTLEVESINPFLGLSKEVQEITLEKNEDKKKDKKIKVRATPREAEMFMLLKKEMNPEDAARVTEIMKTIIKRANETLSDEDIDSGIAKYYGKLFTELGVMFGFMTREQIDSAMTNLKKKTVES
jgi:hypothetical protein